MRGSRPDYFWSRKSFVIILSSYLHQILHQDTHFTLTHTFHKKYLLNTPYTSYRS